MKNKQVEQSKRRAKLCHRTTRYRPFHHGILVRHLYDEANPQKYSWWDDLAFIQNDYLVNVTWQHPRDAYKDKVEKAAYEACASLSQCHSDDLFANATPNYRPVGNSRKRIVSYTNAWEDQSEYFKALQNEETRIARDPRNGIMIVPKMTSEWTNWSRFVSLCAPIEVRNRHDLIELANLTKRLLKHETTLQQAFPDYSYGPNNWVAEFEESDVIGVLSHAICI